MLAHLPLACCVAAASSVVQRSPTVWLPFLQFLALRWLIVRYAADADLSDSPLTPTRSSNLLLRFWGEDLNRGGDIFAEQFWGDIFAKLLHHTSFQLTAVHSI